MRLSSLQIELRSLLRIIVLGGAFLLAIGALIGFGAPALELVALR